MSALHPICHTPGLASSHASIFGPATFLQHSLAPLGAVPPLREPGVECLRVCHLARTLWAGMFAPFFIFGDDFAVSTANPELTIKARIIPYLGVAIRIATIRTRRAPKYAGKQNEATTARQGNMSRHVLRLNLVQTSLGCCRNGPLAERSCSSVVVGLSVPRLALASSRRLLGACTSDTASCKCGTGLAAPHSRSDVGSSRRNSRTFSTR